MQKPDTKQRKETTYQSPLLFLLIVAVYAAHQDVWNWRKAGPMLFGFLPVGLAYHAAYSMAAAVLMAILVKCAWPKGLDKHETAPPEPQRPH
jgi:hypothetical protein